MEQLLLTDTPGQCCLYVMGFHTGLGLVLLPRCMVH